MSSPLRLDSSHRQQVAQTRNVRLAQGRDRWVNRATLCHRVSHRNLNEDRPDLLARRSHQFQVLELYARPESSSRYLLQYRMLSRRIKRSSPHRQTGNSPLSPLCCRPKMKPKPKTRTRTKTRTRFEALHQRQHNDHNLTRATQWHKLRPNKRSWGHRCLSSRVNSNKS